MVDAMEKTWQNVKYKMGVYLHRQTPVKLFVPPSARNGEVN